MTQINKRKSQAACPCLRNVLQCGLFKALADPSRTALLARVAEMGGPATVSQVAACCPTDISVVSRHLAVLRDAGLLHAEKKGREVLYSVRCSEVIESLRSLADALEACCPSDEPGKSG